ncbi:MAG: RNA methyltransferase [Flavobacteriales bacterium]|nr:RNA methyltransferase [Flavobacteriales bacterium]
MRKLRIHELDRLSPADFKGSEKVPVIAVLDNIRSLHNVGSVFRTADAFRLEAVYLCGITAQPPHREIEKTALGATETVQWQYFNDTLEAVKALRADGFLCVAVEQVEQSVDLRDWQPHPTDKVALILGNEVKGVQQKVIDQCDSAVEIPQFGTKHSLNVSISSGIVLWEAVKPFLLRLH